MSIYNVKEGDFIKLPNKMKFNGVHFDLIGVQSNSLTMADSSKYYIDGKLLVERLDRVHRTPTIFIEHDDLENMKSKFKKYFKDLPEPRFYYGKKIAEMEIVEEH